MKLLMLFAVFIYSTLSVAQNKHQIFFEQVSENLQSIHIVYPQEHVWIYLKYNVAPGELQNLVDEKVFANKKKVDVFISNLKLTKINNNPVMKFVDSENSARKVWQDTQKWDEKWEEKYSKWVKENVTKDFFVKYNIATDCADAAIAFRWIFSRINGLPAGQTLAGSNVFFSNRSFKNSWKHLKTAPLWYNDQIFMRSLKYLMNTTYTHTLFKDSYPVKISSKYLNEGSYFMTIGQVSGHTVFIHRQNERGIPLQSINSTVPKQVRGLYEAIFLPYQVGKKNEGGLVKPRWVYESDGRLKMYRPKNMPGFSEEQYDEEFATDNFALKVLKLVDPNFSAYNVYNEFLNSIKQQIVVREQVVKDGYDFCKKNDCTEGTSNYENWSTPSRDKRLLSSFFEEVKLYSTMSNLDDKVIYLKDEFYQTSMISIAGKNYSYGVLSNVWTKGYFSYHPSDNIFRRWSLDPQYFVQGLAERLDGIIQERDKKVNDSSCHETSCELGSKKWLKEQTLLENEKLKVHLINLLSYCSWVEEDCDDFYNSHISKIKIKNYLISDLMSQMFLSFDPNSRQKERKSLRTNLSVVTSIFPNYFGQTKDYIVRSDVVGNFIHKLHSIKKDRLNLSGEVIAGDLKSNMIFFKNDKKYYFYNIDTDKIIFFKLFKEIKDVQRVYLFNKVAIIAGKEKVFFVSLVNDELEVISEKIIDEFVFLNKFNNSPESVVVETKNYIHYYNLESRIFKDNIEKKTAGLSDILKFNLVGSSLYYGTLGRGTVYQYNLITEEASQIQLEFDYYNWIMGEAAIVSWKYNFESDAGIENSIVSLKGGVLETLLTCYNCQDRNYNNYIYFKDKNKLNIYTYNSVDGVQLQKPNIGEVVFKTNNWQVERYKKTDYLFQANSTSSLKVKLYNEKLGDYGDGLLLTYFINNLDQYIRLNYSYNGTSILPVSSSIYFDRNYLDLESAFLNGNQNRPYENIKSMYRFSSDQEAINLNKKMSLIDKKQVSGNPYIVEIDVNQNAAHTGFFHTSTHYRAWTSAR